MFNHLEAISVVSVELLEDPHHLETVSFVAGDRLVVRDPHLESDPPDAAHRADLDERIHQLAADSTPSGDGRHREHPDAGLAVRADPSGGASGRAALELGRRGAAPRPTMQGELQG